MKKVTNHIWTIILLGACTTGHAMDNGNSANLPAGWQKAEVSSGSSSTNHDDVATPNNGNGNAAHYPADQDF